MKMTKAQKLLVRKPPVKERRGDV